MNEEQKNTPKTDKKKKKQRMLIGILIVTVLAVVSYILLENPQIFEGKKDTSPTSMYSDKLYSYVFYPTDYNLDVTADETYMGYDRLLHYKSGSVTIDVSAEDAAGYNDAVAFFVDYFDTVIAGDADTYNTYFTDQYYESADPYDRFAPQMLYDMLIEQLSESTSSDGITTWGFNVSYKIHRNDGTFRNDLPSDAYKKLYFELVSTASGDVKINRITYYK
ncbi:MAG: hypothetical protein IJ037_10260 [Clostridia bacterium]|nr:hypothetical protein [Clostridia bacterium]MBQ8369980.1 hypothetical protein [Clostridia bacterium]MBQ8513017.1 hypothetical protein [Clostridia bacterium]